MAEYATDRPKSGPGSGRRSRRSANAKRRAAIEASSRDSTQPVNAASGRPYGERKATEDSQREIPLSAAARTQRADLASALAAASSAAPPGDPISAPSSRPGEPVTAGLPVGAGPGPEALTGGMVGGVGGISDAELIRALYRRHPTEAMRRLVERVDRASGLDRMMAVPEYSGLGPPDRYWGSDAADEDKYWTWDENGNPIGTWVFGEDHKPHPYEPSRIRKTETPLEPGDPLSGRQFRSGVERRKGGRNARDRGEGGSEDLYQSTEG